MKIDELIEELEQIREEHGNIEVGINYEMCAYRDISKVVTREKYGKLKAWVVDGRS